MRQALKQTQRYLQHLLTRYGIRPRSGLGQNFLVDLNLLRLLVQAADLQPSDVVLEVGAGTGALTAELAQRARAVLAVEVDAAFHALAAETVRGFDNVTLLHCDILKGKNRLHPQVLDRLQELLPAEPGPRLKLVANLPFQVATPVIANLLALDLPLVSLTVTIQQEFADRLMAQPSSKSYGALSVWVQAVAEVKLLRRLQPSVFWPRPKVSSAIVHIVPSAERRARIAEPAFFQTLVRRTFLHRRKGIGKTLAAEYKRLSKDQAAEVLTALGISPMSRPEHLTVAQWITLANALCQQNTA